MHGDDFSQFFKTFQYSAFRLEALDRYIVDEEREEFARFCRGEKSSKIQNRDWAEIVRSAITSAKKMSRVHVIQKN